VVAPRILVSLRGCAGLVSSLLILWVVAACTVATVSPYPSVSTQSPDDFSMEMNAHFVQDVPAGGSLDIPLVFEQSPVAAITVIADDPGVTASIGGTPLTVDTSGSMRELVAQLTNPADATLHVANSGSAAVKISGAVTIQTTRRLSITAASASVSHRGQISFDVTLTQSVSGDSPVAELVDPTGTHTPITLTQTGSGHWTGQVAPTVGGMNTIWVSTSGAGARYAYQPISVATGNVTLGSGFSERLVDTDYDGLANQLVLSPTVTVQTPGTYWANAYLVDANGKEVDVHGTEVNLVAGSQPLDFTFDGSTIYKSGSSGPYRLVNVTISTEGGAASVTEASADDMGTTQSYDYYVFQH
jgi:hypothetical protein